MNMYLTVELMNHSIQLPKRQAGYQNYKVFVEVRVSQRQDSVKGSLSKVCDVEGYQDWGLGFFHSKELKQ